jgi:hypothetical protein
MPSTIGLLPQYEVLAALGSNPATLSVVSNRLVSCQITRGRTDELGTMQTSTMTLILDNGDGAFSPDNPSSPYAGYLVPGRKMQIAARFDTATAWNPLFTGYIDSIRPEDNGPLDSNVIIQCIDWLGKINIKSVTGNVTSGGAGPHDLINWFASLMTLVDSSITYTIVNPTDGTSQNLLDYAVTDKNALQAVQEFAETVHGVVFTGADGTVRATANGGTAVTTLFNTYFVFDQQGLNPAANVVPYTVMDYDLTTQFLYNDITVTATGTAEGPQNAQDAASIAAYGKRSLKFDYPFMGRDQAKNMSNTLMLAYRNPKPRIHALTIDVDGATGITQSGHTAADLLFGLEITVPVTVVKAQPGNVSINRAMIVEGIKHDIKPDYGGAGAMHEIALQLTDTKVINPDKWMLGISQLGISTVLVDNQTAFNPTSVPNCMLYLRSDLGVATVGTYVSTWIDQSSAARNASAVSGKQPTIVPIVQNGKPAIRFAPGSLMTLSSSPFGTNWTVFIVFALVTPSAGGWLIADENPGGTAYHSMVGGTTYQAYDTDGTNIANATTTATLVANTAYIQTGSSAAGQPTIVYLNNAAGVSFVATSPISSYSTTQHYLGGVDGNNSFVGDIFAVVVFNRVLTDTERQYVINGLNTLYNVY